MLYNLIHKIIIYSIISLFLYFIFNDNQTRANSLRESNLNSLWEEVLNDPNNSSKNIEYAILAQIQGYDERAESAYKRVLAFDPNNDLARRKLTELIKLDSPGKMSGTFILSSAYQSNGAQGRADRNSDKSLSETFVLTDERHLFGTFWKSTFLNFADSHSQLRGSDILFSGVKTGPSINISNDDRLDLGLNFENTIINQKIDSYSTGLIGEFEFKNEIIENLAIGTKYLKSYSEGGINYLNLFFSSLLMKYENTITNEDEIDFKLGGKLNLNEKGFNSSGSRDRLVEIDFNMNYNLSLFNSHSMDFFFSPSYVRYFKHRIDDKKDRKDLLLQFGISYNIPILDNLSVTCAFLREQKYSNFREFKYFDNLISSSLIFSF